jgi:hypothetical protein
LFFLKYQNTKQNQKIKNIWTRRIKIQRKKMRDQSGFGLLGDEAIGREKTIFFYL